MAVSSLQDAIRVLNECNVRVFAKVKTDGKAKATIIATSPLDQKDYYFDRKQQAVEGSEAKWQFVLGRQAQQIQQKA